MSKYQNFLNISLGCSCNMQYFKLENKSTQIVIAMKNGNNGVLNVGQGYGYSVLVKLLLQTPASHIEPPLLCF